MNILYLHCHDAGRYIQPYGYALKTPNLQQLAEDGMLFRQAHCGNPTCSPSRACLLTGQSAHAAGMLGLAHRGWRLNDYGQTLPSLLRQHGFHCVLSGQQHIANKPYADPEEIGYHEVLTLDAGLEAAATHAERFLENRPDKPFFLDVGFFAPHRNLTGDFPRVFPPEDERYLMPPACLPDNPAMRRDFALYAASVRSMDFAMGRVLAALERTGVADDTLVICTTDHGPAFPSMKCRLTDHGTGVMLIMRGPKGFSGGKTTDALVSHLDIYPSVCELLDIPVPDWVEGKSFLGLINGKTAPHREEIFAEVNFHAALEPMRAVRTKRWKYIRHYSDHGTTVLPNIDDCISKYQLTQQGLKARPIVEEQLFDLVYDPQESNNLIDASEHAEVLEELREKLDAWMERTHDPLLNGPLDLPEGAITTDPGLYSPAGRAEPHPEEYSWSRTALDYVERSEKKEKSIS